MTDKIEKPEIVFAPGCFDNFDGTQEELDELLAEINRLVDSGELFERAVAIPMDELDDNEMEILESFINASDKPTRNLQ